MGRSRTMQTMTIHRQSSRSTLPHHRKPTQSSNGADPHDELFRSRETSGRLRDKDGFQLFPRSENVQIVVDAAWAVALFPRKVAQEANIKKEQPQLIVVASSDHFRNNEDEALLRGEIGRGRGRGD